MNPIVQWVLRTMMKGQTGVVRALPKKELLDLNVNITVERLIKNGIDPSAIKTPDQVDNIIKQIEQPKVIPADSPRGKGITEALFGKRGEVFDMEGKKIKPGSKIMGGKEVKDSNVDAIIADIKAMDPMDSMKEANSVIGRKGKYKNLTSEESKKILQDTEDHIFERDIPDPEDMAQGGRAGYANGTPNKKITIDAAGSKSGKQQIMGAPEGITMDNESINAIIKADIPISQKIDLLAKYQYGKGRTRIERDDQEIVLDEGGFKSRDIGLGFNKAGEGIGGTLMYNLETGEPQFNIGFKKSFADGGRIGLKAGMTKRAFLKLMGGVGAGIAGLKSGLLGLGGKQATKEVAKEIITTPAAAGKPAWFDALVTRVIREGDDVTKTMATKDREIVYRKKIDDETEVLVTQDLDEGVTRIDIDDSTRNVTGFDDPPTVSLQVTDEIVEEGGAKIKPEFKATENDYRNYTTDPDGGYETEFVENTVENTKDLTSDLTKVKSFATNKKETMKEFVESKKRKDNVKYANENPSSYAADRGPDYDPSDYIDDMADDFASGGIARMLGE